jgi:DNA ligase (NAD+)
VRPTPVEGGDAGPLAGLTFVFTGALADFTRAEAAAAVEDRGGRARDAVSGRTDYVVVGDAPGAKRDAAEAEGATILDEAAFKQLLTEGDASRAADNEGVSR